MRYQSQEFVLGKVRVAQFLFDHLCLRVEASVIKGDRCPGRDTRSKFLIPLTEHAGFGVTKEQPAEDGATTTDDGNAHKAAHRRVPLRVYRARGSRSGGNDVMNSDRTFPLENGQIQPLVDGIEE